MAKKVTLVSGYIFAWSLIFLLMYVPLILLFSHFEHQMLILLTSVLISLAATKKFIRVELH